MKLTEKAYINKWAITGHAIIDTVLFLAYALEFFKGSRTLGYTLIMAALTVIPVVLEILIYNKNKEEKALRHVVGISYGILYLFVLFTTTSLLPFTYVFPMFIVLTLYSDFAYCMTIAVLAMIANIANIVYTAVTVGIASETVPDVEIRVACMALVVVFMVFTTYANKKINLQKLDKINSQNDSTQRILADVMRVSNGMIRDIEATGEKMDTLGVSVEHIRNSMGEVSQGNAETAESVQLQLEQTEKIQNHIESARQTTLIIEESMRETMEMVEAGRKKMDELAERVASSMEANDKVTEQMEALSEYTKRMNSITETITSIANSTGMLALNASIEAARAGEAGRGFAVVAEQISQLASQTKEATVNITSLIDSINKELKEVVNAVNVVTQSNRENAESTVTIHDDFIGIASGTETVEKQTRQLAEEMESLDVANGDIVDKIQTISAITEEVAAHANETYESCEANALLVEQVTQIVQQLNAGAKELKATN